MGGNAVGDEPEDPVADELEQVVNGHLALFDQFGLIARRRDVMITITVTPFDERVTAHRDDESDAAGDGG